MTSLDMNDVADTDTDDEPTGAPHSITVDVTFVLLKHDAAAEPPYVSLSQEVGLAFWGWASYFTAKTITYHGARIRAYQVRATVEPTDVVTGADAFAGLCHVTDQISDTLLKHDVGFDPTYTAVHTRLHS